MREYTDYYVAFMDLLGFKNIINDKDYTCEDIACIFDEIKTQYYVRENEIPMVNPDDIKYKVMSDSICIYIESAKDNSLLVLVFLCIYFQVRLLRMKKPILVRGGISRGEMYLNGDVMFGKGLSKAYILEDKMAKFPRIIIPLDIADTYINHTSDTNQHLLNGFLFKDFDAFYTLNYFDFFIAWGYKQEDGKRVKELIYDVLSKSVDEKIREKYLYLRNYIIPKIDSRSEDNNA